MRRIALFIVVAWLVSWPAVAQPEHRVELVIAGERDVTHAAIEVIGERLRALDVQVAGRETASLDLARALTPDAAAPDAVARIWIDLRDAGAARAYLADGALERVLVRTLTRGDRSDEVIREELGLIVQATVETLLAGTTVGAPRDDVRAELGLAVAAPEPPPAPSATPAPAPPSPPTAPSQAPHSPAPSPSAAPAPPAWRLGGALTYEAQGYAAEQIIVHGPGVALGVDAPDATLGPGAMLEIGYRLPYETVGDVAGFRLQSVALRLQAYAQVLRLPLFVLRINGGVAAEILFLDPFLVGGGEALASPERARVAPIVRLGLTGAIKLVGDTSLRIGAAGDIDVIGTRYVIEQGDALIPLVEPLRVRPALTLGIATTLAGAQLFPDAGDPFFP